MAVGLEADPAPNPIQIVNSWGQYLQKILRYAFLLFNLFSVYMAAKEKPPTNEWSRVRTVALRHRIDQKGSYELFLLVLDEQPSSPEALWPRQGPAHNGSAENPKHEVACVLLTLDTQPPTIETVSFKSQWFGTET